MMRKIISILCLFAFLLAGCAAPARQAEKVPAGDPSTAVQPAQAGKFADWPTKSWQVSTPAEQGVDAALLEKMLAEVKAKRHDINGVLVIRNGYLVSETYFGGEDAKTLHVQYSVTKSFTSTLLGIALDQGKLESVEQKVSEVLPGRTFQNTDPGKEAMTVEHLLSMSSGLGWKEENPSYNALYTSPDGVQWVMDLPMVADPGEKFNYCSGCSHVLSAIVRESTGMDVEKFGREYLFDPLGITKLRWETDPRGLSIGGWGLFLSARDMAKLGYLFLNKGSWDGKQVVSSSWVEAATSKHIDNPGWRLDYGYQWWIARDDNTYAALGRDGQMIYVDPARSLIVVFTASGVSHDVELDLIEKYVVPAVK